MRTRRREKPRGRRPACQIAFPRFPRRRQLVPSRGTKDLRGRGEFLRQSSTAKISFIHGNLPLVGRRKEVLTQRGGKIHPCSPQFTKMHQAQAKPPAPPKIFPDLPLSKLWNRSGAASAGGCRGGRG